jgi:hypothetical protein
MIIEATTANGSVYRIDYDKKTWERIEETRFSGQIRTEGGEWTEVLLVEGFPMLIEGPPLDRSRRKRQITTTEVTKVKEVHGDNVDEK